MHPPEQDDQAVEPESSTDEELSPTRLDPRRRLLVSRIAVVVVALTSLALAVVAPVEPLAFVLTASAAPVGLLGKKSLIAYAFTTATVHLGLFTFGSTGTITVTTTAVFAHLGVSMVLFLVALFAGGAAFANPWRDQGGKGNDPDDHRYRPLETTIRQRVSSGSSSRRR